MGKMKELAYTMERLDNLFRYLELLERMQSYYTVNDRVTRLCDEIEKELELGKERVTVKVDMVKKHSDGDLGAKLADKIFKSVRDTETL